MDEDLQRLPSVYAEYLRLRRLGIADDEIARRFDVDVQVVPLMRRLAVAKLRALSSAEAERPVAGGGRLDRFGNRGPGTRNPPGG